MAIRLVRKGAGPSGHREALLCVVRSGPLTSHSTRYSLLWPVLSCWGWNVELAHARQELCYKAPAVTLISYPSPREEGSSISHCNSRCRNISCPRSRKQSSARSTPPDATSCAPLPTSCLPVSQQRAASVILAWHSCRHCLLIETSGHYLMGCPIQYNVPLRAFPCSWLIPSFFGP